MQKIVRSHFAPIKGIALQIARKFLTGLGFTAQQFNSTFIGPAGGAEQAPYSSFFEAFRYSSNPLSLASVDSAEAFIASEAHFDIGCITVTTASSLGWGNPMQLLSSRGSGASS
eukprot:Cvel_1911.t2-p1 / transcript=Cvel_1911.t2 / gene=Cvel_1911 / organism=Chromera_velia_CCMP2878 / gene_product=hypothetical protein / transcript_product=hypothetical protein / location=Cvel_scaffold71:130310-130648(+) / protein_length=113 / sequence_SO=supercontig / SO=protein_coding / is_pseudo=false